MRQKANGTALQSINTELVKAFLNAVKPLLLKCQLDIKIDDEITYIGNRHYVKSTATLTDGQFKVSATSSAREPEQKKVSMSRN